jgi:hypothetical protein
MRSECLRSSQDLTHALHKDNFLDHLIAAAEELKLIAVRS